MDGWRPKPPPNSTSTRMTTRTTFMDRLLSEWEQRAAWCRSSGRAELDRENDLGAALLPRRGRCLLHHRVEDVEPRRLGEHAVGGLERAGSGLDSLEHPLNRL